MAVGDAKGIQALSPDQLVEIASRTPISASIQTELLQRVLADYEMSVRNRDEDNNESYSLPEYAYHFATNPSLTLDVVRDLSKLKSEVNVEFLYFNPATPAELLEEFVEKHSNRLNLGQSGLAMLIDNPNCSRELAMRIAMDVDLRYQEDVLEALAEFPRWTSQDRAKLRAAGVEGFE